MQCQKGARTLWRGYRYLGTTSRVYDKASHELLPLKTLQEERHHRLAKEWVEGFIVDDIPKKSCEVTYARSSGPGGQHVNKTSSKAVIRLALSPALGAWLPKYCLTELQKSPYYLSSPPSLLVSNQNSRSAPENLQNAMTLLHRTIKDAAQRPIINETPPEQKKRVADLVVKEKAQRRMMKDKQKANKAMRRGDY